MGRRRRCKSFAWRDEDPAYLSARINDRIVFLKLKRELDKTPAGRQPSVVRLVRLLSKNPLWGPRLRGKSPESWKRTYNRWRQNVEKRDSVQAEKSPFDPRQCESKPPPEKFYQETGVKYPHPRDMVSVANKGKQMKSYQQTPSAESKKSEMKKRHSPLRPPIEKKQREKKLAGLLRSTVYRGRAGACAGARRGIAAVVAEVVEHALTAFGGTRGPKPSDEAIWAEIAWRIGPENFAHAVIDKISENNTDGMPRRPPAAFQKFLNDHFPKPQK